MMANQSFTINIKALFDASEVKAKVGDIQSTLSKLKLPDKLTANLNTSFTNVNKALDDFISRTEKGVKSKADATGITKSFEAITKELTNLDNLMMKVKSQVGDGADLSKIIKIDDKTRSGLVQIEAQIKSLQAELSKINTNKLSSLEQLLAKIKSGSGAQKQGQAALELFKQGDVEGAIQSLDKIIKKLEDYKRVYTNAEGQPTRDLTNVSNSLQQLRSMREEMSNAQKETADKVNQINTLSTDAAQRLAAAQARVVSEVNNSAKSLDNLQKAAVGAGQDINNLTASQAQFVREVDQVKSRIQYFFGIANAINLVKRAIRGAVETVKELDKAMTETAVVTNYTISDMWKQLPDYTQRANELGVTTKDAYEAATLYYQQGLNTEQAAALSVETLKMARIAGLDAADATDRMTNALRGFNMELNAMSAQRVDDVYSQLAAMSASNVDEISTAMTKVASLAHSANMEFETTAAFLAQIIETTRESAETAGTALKTVAARFSEVKKLYDMDELKGKDEEGQTLDVNRVSQALRTAGIDLNKYFLGEVGLDDIFMELASKWDSLTSVQQRYIATQAAGSRQQSRFIALMQDYARTQQLVSAAYNANGASAKQFEKTQESLQSKLARLKNAWDQFLMGLANNAIIKTAVDLLTGLLNIVNSLTEAFGTGVGSILKWVAVITAFAGVKQLFASGGLVEKGLTTLVGNTIIGNALQKAGITGQAPIVNPYQGPPTANGKGPAPTIIGNLGNLASAGWGAAQKLGNRVATTKLGYKLGMSTSSIGGGIGKSALTATSAGLVGLGTAIAGVTAAIVAAYGIYKAWEKFSPEGQLKTAKKEAEKANKEAQEAQENYKKLNSLQDTYKDKTEKVNNAINTQDQRAAIKERNDAILNAIKEDGTLAQYVITEQVDNEIILRVDEAGLAKAAEEATKIAEEAAIKSYFKEADVDIKKGNVAKSQLERIYRIVTNENPDFLSAEQIYKEISSNSNTSESQRSNAAEYYLQYTKSYNAAEQQAKLAYGQQLSRLNVSDDLTNALMPLLSEAYLQNQKQLSNEQLKTLIGTDNVSKIAAAFSGAIKSNKSLVDFNVEGDLTDVLGINIESDELNNSFKQLETTLGLAEGTIKDTIKQNVKLQKQRQEEVTKQATMTMIQGEMVRPGSYSTDTMANYLALENFDNQQFVANLLGQIGNADYANLLINPIIDAMSSGKWENSDLQQWIETIDFSNPIQGAAALNQGLASTIPIIRELAGQILSTSGAQAQFSKSAQLSYLITSESYDSLSDSLSKFIEENGKITSTNVKELAESNEDLNAILENNVTTAKGLAEILTHIEKGTIQVWDLSDAVIAATAAMDDLDGIVESTIDDLNSFDAGFDENDITGFIQKAYKTISDNLEIGAIGNNQNRTYLEKIFGNDIFNFGNLPVDEWGRQYEQKVSQLTGILEANQENMYSAWQGVLGTYENASGEQFKIFERDNEIFIEGARVTTDELISILADQKNAITGQRNGEQWARMMVSDYKNMSPDFAYQQGLADLEEGIKVWADKLGTINGSKIYTDTDIHTLATLFDVDSTVVEAAITKLGDSAGELKNISFDLDENGSISGEEYIKTFEKAGVAVRGFYSNVETGQRLVQESIADNSNKVINFDQLKQAFGDAGLSNAFEGVLNECISAGDHFVAEIGGQLRDIEVQAGETASDAYNRVTKAVADQQFAQQIGQEIAHVLSGAEDSQINITFLPQTEDFDAKVEEVATKKTELETPVTTTLSATDNASGVIQGVKSELDSIPSVKTITLNAVKTGDWNTGGGATGGVVQSYASGSENNKLHPGVALTGEEGPEIVWNKEKGYAYITGGNHPEFQNLQPGDRVFNAQETKKILGGAATGGKVPSFARGYGGVSSSGGSSGGRGSGGGGSDDKTPEEWKNDLDWLYNLMEDIVELERDQKAIEEQYEDYLSDQTKTGGDLYRLLVQQLGNLYTQLNHQTFALEKREQEMREFMDITNDQDQYLWYNWQDRTLEIDWDAIDQITDEEQYKHVKELVDQAEEIQDKIDDADDAVMDITNQIQELENVWRDTFTDFEDRVLDAIVKSYQQVIDKYSELNDTLNNSNTQILDSLQKQISLSRQIRDNTKTEEEISDEEARLAYLRRDTSGGNDLAALQLERELDDQRKNYEDTLVDQAINRLQEGNDAAAQQRERQIEIMQAQLDYQSESGEFNAYISELLTSAMGADGELLTNSDLVTLLKEQENWDAMSAVSKQVWEEELNGTFKEVAAFLLKQNAEENGTFYTALTAAVESVSSAIGSYSQAMVKLGSSISSAGSSGGGSGGYSGGSPDRSSSKGSQSSTLTGYAVYDENGNFMNNFATQSAAKSFSGGQSSWKIKKLATGGLVPNTGLAWLDGTPSEPEYVLNARQTDAFLKLADVLPSMMNGTLNNTSNAFGATYVNFSVNLESVSPDYDVDRMVDLVKDKLCDSATYRNNNVLSFLR